MKISKNPKFYSSTVRQNQNFGFSCSQIFLTIFYLAVLGGIIYFLFFSSFFEIDKIEIKGTGLINKTEFSSQIQPYKKKNLLLLNTSKIRFNLIKNYPESINIFVSKSLPSILKVQVFERKPVLVWRKGEPVSPGASQGGNDYLLDQDGYIIRVGKIDSFKNYIVVFDLRDQKVSEDEAFISTKFIDFNVALDKELKEKKLLSKKSYTVGDSEFELTIQTQNLKILFNIIRDPKEQVEALEKVYSKISKEAKEYIDLRVPGKIFYK